MTFENNPANKKPSTHGELNLRKETRANKAKGFSEKFDCLHDPHSFENLELEHKKYAAACKNVFCTVNHNGNSNKQISCWIFHTLN